MNKLIILGLLLGACTPCEHPVKKTVVKVGACNKNGRCSVLYNDGTKERCVFMPVEGEVREACSE